MPTYVALLAKMPVPSVVVAHLDAAPAPDAAGQLVRQVSPLKQIVVAPKVVVVALVPKKVEAKSVVEVAFVAWSVVEKKVVDVACEVVALRAEKSWKVEEAETNSMDAVALVVTKSVA